MLPLDFFNRECRDLPEMQGRSELFFLSLCAAAPAPLQPDLEQELGLPCTNEMEWQEIQVGNGQCVCTESHSHRITGRTLNLLF